MVWVCSKSHTLRYIHESVLNTTYTHAEAHTHDYRMYDLHTCVLFKVINNPYVNQGNAPFLSMRLSPFSFYLIKRTVRKNWCFLNDTYLLCVCMCLNEFVCITCMCVEALRGQKRVSGLLELSLQVVVCHLWVMGTEPSSSAYSALKPWSYLCSLKDEVLELHVCLL